MPSSRGGEKKFSGAGGKEGADWGGRRGGKVVPQGNIARAETTKGEK